MHLTFASPLWLTALAPLAALVLYLLWGRRRQQAVPFLDLWLGPVKGPRPRRRVAAPPLALALAILAMLLAVVGAARPALWQADRGPEVTIIIDRGATMAPANRLAQTAAAADQELRRWGASTPVRLWFVPGGEERTTVGEWQALLARRPPTALDTTDLVSSSAAQALAESNGAVLVLTDRPPGRDDDRLVRVPPPSEVHNAGITLLAARPAPRPQVMVRVVNNTNGATGDLRVASAGHSVSKNIELPKPGAGARDYFVDLPQFGDWVKAELAVTGDDFVADNAAWLVREGIVPRLEPRAPLPPELRRMVEVYSSSRKPGPGVPAVAIVREASQLAPGVAGVIASSGGGAVPAADVQVQPHAVTRETRWAFDKPVRVTEPPGADWTPLVSFGGRVAVAVRDLSVRQAWVGLDSEEWPHTSDYVVFWGNLFDWLAGGGVRFESHPPGHMQGAWRALDLAGGDAGPGSKLAGEPGLWPGVYQRVEDGALRAVNVRPVGFGGLPPDDWQPKLSAAVSRLKRGGDRPLSPAVLLVAAACAAASAVLWKGRSLTAFSGRRTVRVDP